VNFFEEQRVIRVGPTDVRVHDTVQVRGELKTVVDLTVIEAGTGRLLHLDDRSTYRLLSGETLPAQDR
jgi:hypothetical protein